MSGWIGMKGELLHTLDTFGAQKDESGRVLIDGKPIVSFMGAGEEMVVPAEATCLIDGRLVGVAHLMSQTSYGLGVVVI